MVGDSVAFGCDPGSGEFPGADKALRVVRSGVDSEGAGRGEGVAEGASDRVSSADLRGVLPNVEAGGLQGEDERGHAVGVGGAVAEEEVEDVLARPMEDRPGRDGSRITLGQTEAGRYLRVIYVPDPTPDSVFVITAYDLGEKALKALRRRQKSSQRKKR